MECELCEGCGEVNLDNGKTVGCPACIEREAREWLQVILNEAENSPHTKEEWQDGLCTGNVGTVVVHCKAALGEIPEGDPSQV